MAGGLDVLGLMPTRVRMAYRVAFKILVGTLWLVGCGPPLPPQTPAPSPGITDPTDPAQRTAVLQYARSLIYDTTEGAYDRNLLDATGLVGTIWPEENIHRTPADTLARSGRIQLRMVLTSPAPGAFPPPWDYLPRDTSYVWVDRRVVAPGGQVTARAVFIPVNPADSVRIRSIVVHREPRSNRASARWTPPMCWSCDMGYWCREGR